MPRLPLALLLLRASRWFDARLLERLEQRGWPRLTPAQSLLFAHLPAEGISPAELSRQSGTSRQATHQLVAGLVDLGLLATVDDEARRRGRVVVLTETGRALAEEAKVVLGELEREWGAARADAVRALLEADDGASAEGAATDGGEQAAAGRRRPRRVRG